MNRYRAKVLARREAKARGELKWERRKPLRPAPLPGIHPGWERRLRSFIPKFEKDNHHV